MKPKILSIILIFSLALNLAVFGTFIFKQINMPSRPDMPPFDPERLPFFNNMKLNEDQHAEIRKLMREFMQSNLENRHVIFELENELFRTTRSSDFDSARVDSLVEKIGQLRMEQTKQAIKHFRKFNKFLTPEQQEHFHRMIMERPGRHERKFRRWRESRRMPKDRRGQFHPDSMDRMD